MARFTSTCTILISISARCAHCGTKAMDHVHANEPDEDGKGMLLLCERCCPCLHNRRQPRVTVSPTNGQVA